MVQFVSALAYGPIWTLPWIPHSLGKTDNVFITMTEIVRTPKGQRHFYFKLYKKYNHFLLKDRICDHFWTPQRHPFHRGRDIFIFEKFIKNNLIEP